jgi:hypothetical protein
MQIDITRILIGMLRFSSVWKIFFNNLVPSEHQHLLDDRLKDPVASYLPGVIENHETTGIDQGLAARITPHSRFSSTSTWNRNVAPVAGSSIV